MPDHLHLCVLGQEKEACDFVSRWKSYTTHESWKTGWSGKLWHERFLIKKPEKPAAESKVLNYVLDNPVEAGLVSMWKEWPYWAEPPYGKKGWSNHLGLVPRSLLRLFGKYIVYA
jgi:REP element-mobilizing transposase RayT